MVRIVIDIEGDKEATTVPQAEAATQAVPEASTPPAEVLAAAAAVGAMDAGPAPSFASPATGAPPLPSAMPQAGYHGAGAEDESAGAAPGTQPEPQPTVVEENGG